MFIRQADVVMSEVLKRIKQLVREWAGIAHDRDLRKALSDLRAQFDRWDRGEINAFALNDLVHQFHQDTSREIWKRYATSHLEAAVASAVAAGVLRKEELPAELLRHIAGLIEFYEHDLSAS
jgi:methylase of polypeptide subunit release factors